jgi:hypothetical protein
MREKGLFILKMNAKDWLKLQRRHNLKMPLDNKDLLNSSKSKQGYKRKRQWKRKDKMKWRQKSGNA